MNSEIRISTLLVRGLREAIQSVGLDSTELCARAGVDLRASDGHGWISIRQFDGLMRTAMDMSRDPSFGLHWVERSPMFQLDLPMSMIVAAPTFRDVVRALSQLQLLFADREQCTFTEMGGRSVLAFDLLSASPEGKRFMTELALGGIQRIFQYRGDERAVRRINVDYATPANAVEYLRLFGARVHFAQPQTSIEFTSDVLERAHPLANEARFQRIGEHAAELRQRVLAEMSVAEQLKGQVRAALPRVLTMTEAAANLGVSERSLRRRLAEEALRFGELVDNVQRERARELLQMGDRTIKEIAAALGFSRTSGFIRAYRRWTGNAPGADRSPRLARARRLP